MGRLLLAVLVLGASASTALAQEGNLWERGVALRREGRDAEALAVFEQAHQQTHSARTLAQVALAEQALGRWARAATHLDAALAAPDAWVTQNRAALSQARAEIARHVGQIEVRVDRPGASVSVDGVAVGTTPLPAPVAATPGSVTVRVRGADGRTVERTAVVAVGGVTSLAIELGAAPAAGGGDALPIVGGVLLGLGGAAAIGMGVAWGLREGHAQRWNSDECWPLGSTREATCPGDREAAQNAEIAAIALGVGAAVLAGLGLTFVLVDGGGRSDRATLECGPAGLGVVCGGRL
jgi:hypothetical protein